MSEYQYYDWQTPSLRSGQAAVNKLSSHIDVTSTWADLQMRYANRPALRERLQRARLP